MSLAITRMIDCICLETQLVSMYRLCRMYFSGKCETKERISHMLYRFRENLQMRVVSESWTETRKQREALFLIDSENVKVSH